MMANKLTIPQILRISKLPWRTAQINCNPSADILINEGRATGSLGLFKPRKATFFKPPYPVLDGTPPMAEKLGYLSATKPGTHEKNAVKPVIISRLLGSHDLLLHSNSHKPCIFNLKLAHGAISFLLKTL
jgi:hypothetical protein